MLPALCFSIVVSGAIAQTTQPNPPAKPEQAKPETAKPEAAKPEIPPDTKAYRDAVVIKDLDKRIEALEKWKSDFPDSQMRQASDSAILSALVQKKPQDQPRIRSFANEMYRNADAKNRGAVANTIAGEYLDHDLLLKDAERYETKSLDSMRLSAYLDEQIAAAKKRKREPPSSEELQKRFLESRALRVGLLGRIEVKLGHTAKGKKLLEEAYTASSTNVPVEAALGELAAQSGDDATALKYLIPARLSGRPDKDAQAALEAIYRKQHGGSSMVPGCGRHAGCRSIDPLSSC